jgi:hypothetical protein
VARAVGDEHHALVARAPAPGDANAVDAPDEGARSADDARRERAAEEGEAEKA